jgi:release factor glutamine methyltransferase
MTGRQPLGPLVGPGSLDALLAEARAAGVARLDAQCLAAHLLGRTRAWVLAHGDEPLRPDAAAALRRLLAERARGVPLAYLVGEREFHGLVLRVTPDTLIPRPDTETLVDWAIERLQAMPSPEVADLGTGSGAIALAIRQACPRARVWAVERSEAALDVARGNGQRLGLDIEWRLGDWWAPLSGQRFDLVVSNPPYIGAADPHLADLPFEPRAALTPGDNGLAALAEIVRGAPAHLKPGGWLLVEHGHDQAEGVQRLLAAAGGQQIMTRRDLEDRPRCTGATWAAACPCPSPEQPVRVSSEVRFDQGSVKA